jgi:HlyB family type I secretion system ABC transporter
MTANLSPPIISPSQFDRVLGSSISTAEFEDCLAQSKIYQPKVGKFWPNANIEPGLYVVVSGKIRLLSQSDERQDILSDGAAFGEFTLFPDEDYPPYSVRASINVKLCLIPSVVLWPLLDKYPPIAEYLRQVAQARQQLLNVTAVKTTSNPLPPNAKITQHSASIISPPIDPQVSKVSKAYLPHPTVRVGHLWQRAIKQYPFFEQQSSSDCGAACLAMISKYWGKKFSINRLRDLANVSRDGSSLRGLSTAAENIGFNTRPVKASVDQLALQPLPAIAHWEGKHYIVVYEITSTQIVIADPALGQRTISRDRFVQRWTGYALILQPTAFLKETPEASTPFWQFFELLKPHGVVMAEIFVASVFIQAFSLITPIFTQLILDRVVVQRSELTLITIGIGLLVFSLFRVVVTGLREYLLDHTANKIDLALIVAFVRHTLRLPLGFFESRHVGDIVSRVEENRKIQRFLSGEALSILLDLLTVFVYVGVMFSYSWSMALLSLTIIPPFLLLALTSTPFLQRISRETFSAYNEEGSYLIEALSGIQTIKSTAVEQPVRWHWEELLHRAVKKQFHREVIGNRLQMVSNTIEVTATTGMLCYGAHLVIQGQLTIGQLVAFNMLLGQIIQPFQRLVMLWNQLQEVVIAMERLNDIFDAEPEEDPHKQTLQSLPPIQGHICFDRVSFRYRPDSDTNVLENLSLEIQPGQIVALVGRSGSGKTTISKLLLGLYPATEGQISIDGHDLMSVTLKSLRQQAGVVDQDTFLFSGTVRENISLNHPGIALKKVVEAATLAGADDFIRKMPMGYETQIGEGGGTLSGGQRQRLAIARALIGQSRLLIFDEATSHLDTESERLIQQNLQHICKGRTTFIIAHRLSTIRHADLILVLDQGILIEQGTYQELMSKRGHFFYLNQQQSDTTE